MKSIMNSFLICLFLSSLQHQVDAASFGKVSQSLRQPSYKAEQKEEEDPNKPEVVKVEEKVRNHHGKMMKAIDKFRAEVCAEMKDDYGVAFKTFDACHKFMEKTCKPGKDMKMDGDNKEVSSGEGFCREYFPEAEKKAKKEVEKEEAAETKVVGPSPGPFPAPGPAPAPASKAPAPAPAAVKASAKAAPAPAGEAPAPGPMGAPGPAPGPVPAPFIPGKSGGKPYGAIAEDEAWYYEKDGKTIKRMHMSEKKKLPTNGYWGKLVEHEDMETVTDDWQREFGPKSGSGNTADICRKHPDSAWCRRKGFGRKHSSAPALFNFVPFLITFLAASLYQ